MSDVKSYVAFKRKALECLKDIDGGQVKVARSGSFWSLGILGEWASICAPYYVGHPQTVEEFCADTLASWELESRDNAHC